MDENQIGTIIDEEWKYQNHQWMTLSKNLGVSVPL